jgi:hypothetical protein
MLRYSQALICLRIRIFSLWLLGGIVAFTGGTLTGAFVVVEAALSGTRVGFRTEMKEGDGPFLPSSVKASPYFYVLILRHGGSCLGTLMWRGKM